METKSFWESKTLWINIIAISAILVQYCSGNEAIDAEAQAMILALVNIILRFITKKPLGR